LQQKLREKGERTQGKISMDLSFCQSEDGFSGDKSVTKPADAGYRSMIDKFENDLEITGAGNRSGT